MFDIGFLELILIAIIGLLVLGPERLPIAARTLGRWVGKARRMAGQFSKEIDRQMELEELKEELKKQSEHLDINEEARKIQDSVNAALKEAEEYEPLPRSEPDLPFSEIGNKIATESNQTVSKNQTINQNTDGQDTPASKISCQSSQDDQFSKNSQNSQDNQNSGENQCSTDTYSPQENHSNSTSKQ